MRAFVTGSTGLLGSNLVQLLVDQGHEVTALVRSPAKGATLLGHLPVRIVRGDVGDVAGFAPALQGMGVLFHAAAYFREYFQPGEHAGALQRVNVQGTSELLAEAERRGVQRAVYVSSSGTVGVKPSGEPGDESTPPDESQLRNAYFRSKVQAEGAIAAFSREHTLPVVTVLPGWMFGPGDAAPTGSGQLVLDFLQRRFPGIVAGGTSVADARDVAQAMIAAAERGRAGERYIVGGPLTTLETIFHTLADVSGVPAPRRHIPHRAMLGAAWAAESWARLTRRPARLTVEGLRTLHRRHGVDSSKAVRELGATFRPLADTLRDEVAWFRQRPPVLPEPAASSRERTARAPLPGRHRHPHRAGV